MTKHRQSSCFRAAPIALVLGVVQGCTVGPDYRPTPAPTPPGWTGAEGAASDRPVGSAPTHGDADIARWWTVFNDAALTSLIERAMAENLGLAQAASRIRQARAARVVAAGGWYPSVNADASASRSRTGGARGASTSNLFRAGFDATWEIDVFGGTRRSVEAAESDIGSAGYAREAQRVTLAGEVASTYFDLRGAQQQLAIARRNLEAQNRTLELTRQRFDAGFVSALDVANARANVTQTEASIPSLDAQARSSIYALGVLLGGEPGALLAELSSDSEAPALPESIPVGLPSDLLLRRPDLRQAEADLHSATARIGVAVADQFPKFSLTGSFGTQGDKVSSLGTLANRYWSIGPSVSLPIFTGGRVEGNIEQAREAAEQAALGYRQSVLTALQEVETALVNFTREQQRRGALSEATEANRQAVDLSLKLYGAGRVDFLNVLQAQRQLFAIEAQLTQSSTNLASDLVALYKALGGGWDPGATTPGAGAP